MFCGSFASTGTTWTSHLANNATISRLEIKNAVFDEVYVTVKVIDMNDFDGSIPDDWDFNTRLNAKFNNNLQGGNVQFTEKIVQFVRIKKRTSKDNKFQTIYEKPITSNKDFAIEFIDYLEPIGTVEYAYVPVISGGESKFITTPVESSFDHCFLIEKAKSYPIILDHNYTETINYETAQVKPLGRKYPIIVVNGNGGYKTGEIEGTFIELRDNIFDVNTSFDYRHDVYDFLTNSNPKLFKDVDGNLLMINITGNINEPNRMYCYRNGNGVYYVKSKFGYAEVGDPYYAGDLYDNNFIDANVDR